MFAQEPNPCIATLSFVGSDGEHIGPTRSVDLKGGQSASLTLNFDKLGRAHGLAGRIEIQPQVKLATATANAAATAKVPAGNSCPASVDVVDDATGRTTTFQSAQPAMQ